MHSDEVDCPGQQHCAAALQAVLLVDVDWIVACISTCESECACGLFQNDTCGVQ